MQVLDSLIDGPLELGNRREGDELIGMIVRYLRTGDEPAPRTDAQRMALAITWPVIKKSRARIVSGSKGGSEQQSKAGSKTASKTGSKHGSKAASKSDSKLESETEGEQPSAEPSEPPSETGSDIYSSSSSPIPESPSEEEGRGEEDGIPYGEVVAALNGSAGTAYRPTSRKTRQLIRARWAEGYRLEDFQAVIDVKCAEWIGGDMARYLRPETLFGPKFEGYREQARAAGRGKGDGYGAYD